jgi:predicted DNA binding CopG/RHH family protein
MSKKEIKSFLRQLFLAERPPKNIGERKMSSKLDNEEMALLNLFDTDKLNRVNDIDEELKKARKAASKHLKKNTRINIRLSSTDLNFIKRIAADEGLPYQTLIASVLHKYVNKRGNVANC